jgi:hypothetical protein
MSREFPMISEFRADSPKCPRGWNGCAVAATEAILRRYRPWDAVPAQAALGELMGRRHRQKDATTTHGICPRAWCAYCSYLELKARHVPVGYGRLSVVQLRDHVRHQHAVHLGGLYNAIHLVSPGSYSRTVPARGRADDTNQAKFAHSLVVWQVGQVRPNGDPLTYIVSDPDFGAPARPVVPPYCEYDAAEVEAMYANGDLRVAYCLDRPPALNATAPAAPAGVTLRFGGEPQNRGVYVVTDGHARQRASPYVRGDNIIREVLDGTEFRVSQTTRSGTNVGGSSMWHGDSTGTVWMHHSVIVPALEEALP